MGVPTMIFQKSMMSGVKYLEKGRLLGTFNAKSWQLRIPPERYCLSHIDPFLVHDTYYPKELVKVACLLKHKDQVTGDSEIFDDENDSIYTNIYANPGWAKAHFDVIAHSEHLDDNIFGVMLCSNIWYRFKRLSKMLGGTIIIETLEGQQPIATIKNTLVESSANFHKDLPTFDKLVIYTLSGESWDSINRTEKWYEKQRV